jgi:hypothetical protein
VCYGIKKRNLIDSLIGTTPGFNQKDSLYFKGKDTKLLSILQIADVKRGKQGDTLQTAASKPHGGISPFYKDLLAHVQGENGLWTVVPQSVQLKHNCRQTPKYFCS